MALPSTQVWEVNQTGVASDSNGGGFDPSVTSPGTDYTYGAGATAIAYTDLASTTGTSASPTVTSVNRAFVAADVGNTIQILSGTNWTAGFYSIRSVSGGAATLDKACGSVASLSAGTGNLGGPFATPGKAAGAKVAGNSVWIKSGTYTLTTSTANVSGGPVNDTTGGVSQTQATRWEGYGTTRGDKGTKPIIAVPAAGTYTNVVVFSCTAAYVVMDNIATDGGGNASTGMTGFLVGGNYQHIIRCKADRMAKGISSGGGLGHAVELGEATRCSTWGIGNNGSNTNSRFTDSYSHGNTGYGYNLSAGDLVVRCIASTNSYGFVSISVGAFYFSCTSYGNTNDGWNLGSLQVDHCEDCISYGNGGKGWNFTNGVAQLGRLLNCAGGSNTGGNYDNTRIIDSGATKMVENFVTLTANPFTNAASGDFSLNSTAGGGAACRAAGYPGAFPGGTTTGYLDIGAAQSQATGGGTTVIVIDD